MEKIKKEEEEDYKYFQNEVEDYKYFDFFLQQIPRFNIFNFISTNFIDLNYSSLCRKISNKKTHEKYILKQNPVVLPKETGFGYIEQKNKITQIFKNFCNDANILSKLSHPSIIKLFGRGYFLNGGNLQQFIVEEYCRHGPLSNLLSLRRENVEIEGWNDTMKLINIYEIASAMSYLHEQNIIHCDLCPNNIFIDESLLPKICNFEMSKYLKTEDHFIDSERKGTLPYVAYETLSSGVFSKASDVFTFSLIVYYIITETEPYSEFNLSIGWSVSS